MSTAPPAHSADWRRAWQVILGATLISSVGSGLTLPFLIVYLHSVRHLSLPVAGAVVAVAALTGLVAGAAGGSLSDRLGLGRVLTGGLLFGAAGTAGLAFVHSAATAAVAVAVVGVGDSLSWPTLNGLIGQNLPAERRPRAFAVRFGVMNAGFGVGGLVSGSVVSLTRPGTFVAIYLVDAASSVVFGLAVAAVLGRRPGFVAAPSPPRPAGQPAAPAGYRAVLADRRFLAWLGCNALFVVFGYAQLDGAWAAFATGVAHVSPQIVGIAFAANTGVIVAMQLAVTHLTRNWGHHRALLVAGGCWAVAWGVSGVSAISSLAGVPAATLLVSSLAIFGVGETLYSPISGALVNDLAPDELRGRYNALSSTVFAAGGLVGPPMAGLLLASGVPVSWAATSAAGCALAALGGLGLRRALPAGEERQALAVAP